MKVFATFLTTLLLVAACSQTSPQRDPSSVSAPDSLILDIAKFTRIITHEVYVYHWAQLPTAPEGNEKSISAEGLKRGQTVAAGFWSDDDPDYGLVGNGLYMARDPALSTRYGSRLISVTLPVGTRLFDIRTTKPLYDDNDYQRGNYVHLSNETQRKLLLKGCTLPGTVRLQTVFTNIRCSRIFKAAFKELKIAGNIHHWWGHNRAVCLGEATAFVLWDEGLFTEKNVRTFSSATDLQKLKTTNPKAMEELAYIYSIAEASVNSPLREGNASTILSYWDKNKIQKIVPEAFDKQNIKSWANAHTFNCTGSYPEDAVDGKQNIDVIDYPDVAINILSATYGGNLDSKNLDNATEALKGLCKTTSTCSFSNYPLGIPGKDQAPGDLIVEWSCGALPEKYRLFVKPSYSKSESIQDIGCPTTVKTFNQPFNRMQITKAMYRAVDVTEKAKSFCHMKPDCEYKISSKFLDLPSDKKPKDFTMEWSCTNTPDKVQSKVIPAPAEGIKFSIDCPQ